jgi:hypothetical protein
MSSGRGRGRGDSQACSLVGNFKLARALLRTLLNNERAVTETPRCSTSADSQRYAAHTHTHARARARAEREGERVRGSSESDALSRSDRRTDGRDVSLTEARIIDN